MFWFDDFNQSTGTDLRDIATHWAAIQLGWTPGYVRMVVSPWATNGSLLASASINNTIKLWEIHTGKRLHTLKGHIKWVDLIVSAQMGRLSYRANALWWRNVWEMSVSLLASGSRDNTIKLWEVSTGKALLTLKGHRGWVESVAFSPDGLMLASGSYDHTIKLWEVSTGALLHTLTGHSDAVYSIAFQPWQDGILASGSEDSTVKWWDVHTGELLRTLKGQYKKNEFDCHQSWWENSRLWRQR